MMNQNYKTKEDLFKHFNANKVYIYDIVSVYLTAKEMGLSYASFIEIIKTFEITELELDELIEL